MAGSSGFPVTGNGSSFILSLLGLCLPNKALYLLYLNYPLYSSLLDVLGKRGNRPLLMAGSSGFPVTGNGSPFIHFL